MFSELAYVKEQLAKHKHSEFQEIADKSGVPLRTLKRVAYGETPFPRSDTVGKLAMHFKTRERRNRK